MKENKLLAIDQKVLTKKLTVFMFKQKNNTNLIAFKDIFIKNEFKYNTTKNNQTSFQIDILAQIFNNLFHTVALLIRMALKFKNINV